ncbi:efflux RND transporter periplasmic adaptor subunit [Mangrovimonas sp. AS39]|uniref:efflux RND transporter periplasmic adaptor subunit n=1 Tax=Mangrovimonas futianensis TaxID=2895523 RepID=UPI001E452F93|nr:efflux RND transporter periplasmic adaptor subunit [Mangrovimonas futianensis]MCF1192898.1 efflux RND transporter periplasmic adaptor subunit [Mangrovimonas futianensis]MCF1196500.1 efflux RND transporter periplasmic adaptor subunit [Mangrovimonas futianensis]
MKRTLFIKLILVLILGIVIGVVVTRLFSNRQIDSSTHSHIETSSHQNQIWTCSMHPQIMQPEPGDCPICGMDLIPAEAGADGLTADQFRLTPNAMALADIQTSVVGVGKENHSSKLSGKIVENEEANKVQASYFSGRIEQLYVSFTGEKVNKGQILATIYSPEIYAAQQELITALSLKESQPELYKAVRNKLKLWKLSDSQINQIEETGKVKENFPVYANVSGTVTDKLVEAGDYVKQGQALLKIANLNSVWAHFDVYENQIEQFKEGQEVKVTTNAYPNKKFKGTVDFINPILNTKTRTVTLRVVLNNKDSVFKPGMFVSAEVEGVNNSSNEVLTVPSSAILWTGERSVVYLKTNPNEPVFEMREVTLGNKQGDSYEILNGLSGGDEIVTNGTFTVDAAAQLQGKKSMMNGNRSQVGFEVPESFKIELQQVYEAYIELKDALVQTDLNLAKSSASQLEEKTQAVDMELLTNDKAHLEWMEILKALKSSTQTIKKTNQIDEARMGFKTLSENLIKAIQTFGIGETTYKQYCPMADSDKGAYWLSKEKEILNPYFGDKMLKCGEVKETIYNK